jgi:putative tricarboxylic transport membrane protein
MKFLIRTLSIKSHILLPVITAAMIIGSFALYNRVFDIGMTLVFGFVGYIFKKIDFPTVPLITSFILGPIVEKNLRQGLASSGGSLLPLLTRPLSLGLLIGAVILFAIGMYVSFFAAKRVESQK